MVETYGAHEFRLYFVAETVYGVTPTSPAMLGVNAEAVDPGLDPGLIKVRGTGSRDLQSLKKGLRRVLLKIPDCLSSESPISLIQHAQTLSSLSVQVLYYKGLWASATDIISFIYKGMRIDKVTVQCSLEDIIKANVEMIGQDLLIGTAKIAGATYGDYAGAVAFNEVSVSRGVADGTSQVENTRVTDWKWTLENNLKPVPVIRSGSSAYLLKYLRERHRNLYGEVTFEFETDDEFDDVINDGEFSLKFGLGPSNSALFKYCKWDEVTTPTRMEDLVSLKAKFAARDVVIS
jgi:hypothetical protein